MSSTASLPSLSGQGVALDGLRGTIDKRIQTLEYLKRAHLGKMYWFNTVLLERRDLDSLFDPPRMRTRTNRFAVLGMSLSALLDIPAAHDFLRGLLSLVQEFDAVPDDKFDRKNQRNLFRVSSRGRKSNAGVGDYSGLSDSGDASYLITPNIPFELDYFQVFLTLCDMLIETYRKILSHLGAPSSSLKTSAFPQPPAPSNPGPTSGGSRWVDRSSVLGSSGSGSVGANGASAGGGSGGSTGMSPALTDIVAKIDSRLKKLIVLTSKEIDGYARAAIKRELSSLVGVGDGLDEYNDA